MDVLYLALFAVGDLMKTLLITTLQITLFALLAPLLSGWIRWVQCHLQNRTAPSVLQPYRNLWKLLHKETLPVIGASWIFYATPYIIFIIALLSCAFIPFVIGWSFPWGLGDAIVLVGLLALARFFLALAGLDLGTAFGGMGASREMMISALAEPSLLLIFFIIAMKAGSSNLAVMLSYTTQISWVIYFYPSLIFALLSLCMVTLAEAGRIPIDNPTTHLELTMVHEAMVLEYSGKYLALIEWASQIKITFFLVLISNFFLPWGIAHALTGETLLISSTVLVVKLILAGIALALVETLMAKMRLFKVPYFLGMAFALCLLGILSHILFEAL